jgi:hypothetical protein
MIHPAAAFRCCNFKLSSAFSLARAFSHPTSGGNAEQVFTFNIRGLARKSNRNEISGAANNVRAIEPLPIAN